MGAIAAVEVAVGFFFSFVAVGLNIFISARHARVGELDGQHSTISVKPMADGATRSFEPCRSVAVEGATTTLAVWVNAEGKVKHVEIRKSCGRQECDAAAMSRALTLEFPPAVDAAAQPAPRLFVIGSDVKELAR